MTCRAAVKGARVDIVRDDAFDFSSLAKLPSRDAPLIVGLDFGRRPAVLFPIDRRDPPPFLFTCGQVVAVSCLSVLVGFCIPVIALSLWGGS